MRALLTALLVLALVTPAMAAFSGAGADTPPPPAKGGFQNSGARGVTKAADVVRARENTPVTLVGFLVEQNDYYRYIFRDDSGKVLVEIDPKTFRGQNVTPNTRVRIVGKVDVTFSSTKEVDVDYLEIVR